MARRHKENVLLSKKNSQNFCFQPIIFEHCSVPWELRIFSDLRIFSSLWRRGMHVLVWDKKKDTFHIMLFAGIFSAFNKRNFVRVQV